MIIKGVDIKIIKEEIKDIVAGAIVHPTDVNLKPQIYLSNWLKKIKYPGQKGSAKRKVVAVGDAFCVEIERGQVEYLIHAVMVPQGKKAEEAFVRAAIAASLDSADAMGVDSIAFPPILGGDIKFPVQGVVKILAQEILKFVRQRRTHVNEIFVCVPQTKLFRQYETTILGYLSHIQDALGEGPFVTVDCIIEMEKGIILIERSNPPYGWALPGGFVDNGESLEDAVRREMQEETNLDLDVLKQFQAYSDANRDPRFHTVSMVFTAKGIGRPKAGDDAKGLKVIPLNKLLKIDYAFDHGKVIKDYLAFKNKS